MAIQAQRYLRKPLYVDAVRVMSANFDEIALWCQGEILCDEESGSGKKYIKVRVHNPKNPRQTKAFVGDWLLYTERGYKVYTSKAFHAAFDLVEDAPVIEEATLHSISAVAANPNPEEGVGEIEVVPATPESIAQAAKDNDEARRADPSDIMHEGSNNKVEPSAAEGKRVLSKEEQDELSTDEVREMVQSGEAVLAQDIAQP